MRFDCLTICTFTVATLNIILMSCCHKLKLKNETSRTYVSLRYRAIVKPLDIQTSSTTASILLRAALIWVLSLVLAVPEAIFSDLHTFNITSTNESFVTCAPYPHAGELHPRIHSMASFLIFYVIPLLVIAVYYTFIAQSLINSASNLPMEGNTHAQQQVLIYLSLVQFSKCFKSSFYHCEIE